MSDTNVIVLVGRLTRDAEVRGGGSVVSMRLASSSRAKDEDGNWGERSNYFDVTHFPRGDGLVQYLVKGKQIAVQGRLQWREYETKDGSKRQSVEVVAESLQLLGGKDAAPVADDLAPLKQAFPGAKEEDPDIPFAASWV